MTARDDWSRDPSVRAMRGLFSGMEAGQDDLLQRLGISPYDRRLRPCREEARDLFERVLSLSAARGRGQDQEDAARLYVYCLVRALKQNGVPMPTMAVTEDNTFEKLFREAME
jgi:hypothetical protein